MTKNWTGNCAMTRIVIIVKADEGNNGADERICVS
jgi:hypothetical protein